MFRIKKGLAEKRAFTGAKPFRLLSPMVLVNDKPPRTLPVLFSLIFLLLPVSGCDGLSVDRLWKEPREILVDRVEGARDAQQETVEEFHTALEQFKSVTRFEGGDLEGQFNVLNKAFKRSEAATENIHNRVEQVVVAANRLLEEWREELEQYHDGSLRQRSEAQFDLTRVQANAMIAAMRKAEAKTKPVLDVFRDQVLFLKHNLNMQAITSLERQTAGIETDVASLIEEMEKSIAEANQFIRSMGEDFS